MDLVGQKLTKLIQTLEIVNKLPAGTYTAALLIGGYTNASCT